MSDVTCACTAPLVAEVRARRLDPQLLVEGLDLDLETLENPRQRVAWDPFTVFARRAYALLGAEVVEELAVRAAARSVPGLLRSLLPRILDARPVYLMGARWWGPWVFRGTRATCEELSDGRLRQVIEILPEYADCAEFFLGLRGVLRAMPLLLGQPEAVVELVRSDARRGEYLITPPPARRGRLGLRRLTRAAVPRDLEELGFGQEQLLESQRRARAARVLLAEQSRQLSVLARIGEEIAETPEGPEQAQRVVQLLQEQLRVQAIRLCPDQPRPPAPLCFAEAGEPFGPASETLLLRAGGRCVGRLELWGFDPEGTTGDDAGLLRDLLPWLGLTLERAYRREAVTPLAEELNDALTVVLGYACLLEESHDGPEAEGGELEQIRIACRRAAPVLQRLLGELSGGARPAGPVAEPEERRRA